MAKIVVGIPTWEGHLQYLPQLLASLKAQTVQHEIFFCNTSGNKELQTYLESTGHRTLEIYPTEGRQRRVEAGRNAIRNAFLQTDATHLCWVDSDMIIPPNAFERLLKDDKDIVGGAYLSPYNINGQLVLAPVAFSMVTDASIGQFIPVESLFTGALLRMRAVGFGLCMIKREVLEKIKIRWTMKNSDDFNFCVDAEKLGFANYLDTKIWAKHHAWPLGDERNRMLDIELQGRRLGLAK